MRAGQRADLGSRCLPTREWRPKRATTAGTTDRPTCGTRWNRARGPVVRGNRETVLPRRNSSLPQPATRSRRTPHCRYGGTPFALAPGTIESLPTGCEADWPQVFGCAVLHRPVSMLSNSDRSGVSSNHATAIYASAQTRHRVDPAPRERMAAGEAAGSQHRTAPGAMRMQGFDRIVAAARAELAGPDQVRPDHPLVAAEQ